MFFKYSIVITLLGFISSSGVGSARTRAKRADIELQTCIDNFDIHKDKIIRTQDSRTMGAKYLNEMDLDSRDECLRLCCETENCDVFVYEEKNAGSCYLFQCGPPEDFKCKFTHHVNYTSAVLAVNRHLPDLESQIKLTKHEQDLTKLRQPDTVDAQSVQLLPAAATTQSTTTTTVKIKDVASVAKTKTPPESRKCSIYQFECQSTGECIAIYNACDGIPQCADGSDEAPELRCPDTATTLAPVQNHPNKPGIGIVPLETQPARFQPVQPVQTPEVYRPQIQPHLNQKLPIIQHQEPDFLRPVDPISTLRSQQYESGQYQPYLSNAQNWPAQQSNPLSPQLHQLQDNKNSHIFNHKDSGLQVSDEGEASQGPYADVRDYPKLSNYYGSEVYGQQIPQLPENWNGNPQQELRTSKVNPYNQEVNPGGRETWSQNVPEQATPNIKVEYKNVPAKQQLPITSTAEKETPKHEQDKMAHELRHSKEHFEAAANTVHPETKAKDVHPEHEEHASEKYAVVAEYKIAADAIEAIEDGVTERPSGAILSLTLGVIITSLMGIFIGCRLRVVRRRLRRGGKSYAHDADYLVNGMYL